MFRYLPILLILLISPTIAVAAAEEPLRPDTLLNWLRIIDLPDARLLYAGDVNGHYIAVKIDKDGDLLFCEHEHDNAVHPNPRKFSLDVFDSNGKSLHDIDSKKKSPDSAEITYRKDSSVGPLDTSSSITVAYPRGVILPLKKHGEMAVTVKYVETTKGNRRVLLSQCILTGSASTETKKETKPDEALLFSYKGTYKMVPAPTLHSDMPRIKILDVEILQGPLGSTVTKITYSPHYGKINTESLKLRKKHETQVVSFLMNGDHTAKVRKGDILRTCFYPN